MFSHWIRKEERKEAPSETTYSRILDRRTAFPSANREYGVFPAPFSCNSYRVFEYGFVHSKRLIARYMDLVSATEKKIQKETCTYTVSQLTGPRTTVRNQVIGRIRQKQS